MWTALVLLACHAPSKDEGEADGSVAMTDTAPSDTDSARPVDTDPVDTHPSPLPCDAPSAPEGPYVELGGSATGLLSACEGVTLVTAGARGMVLTATMTGWTGADASLDVYDLAGYTLLGATPLGSGGAASFALAQTGETFLRVLPPDDAEHAWALTVTCTSGCDRAYTRYPLVLLHGMGGADTFNGVDYFFEVRQALEARGYLVRTPTVEPFASSEVRGAELIEALDGYAAAGLGRRFDVVAHSQGGLDARWAISGLGRDDLVAALVMVGTPNHGSPVADAIMGVIDDGTVDGDLVDLGTAAFAALFGLEADDPSLVSAMTALSTEAVEDLNARAPDVAGVYYTSWAGETCGSLEPDCQDTHGGEVVDALLEPLYLILWAQGIPGDALVPTDSAPWGDYRGVVYADHADEIGQFEDEANTPFQHLPFYEDEADRLHGLGY